MLQASANRQSIATYLIRTVEARPWTVLPLWLFCYLSAILPSAFRPFWYDELLTYYGAMASSLSRFWIGITHFDFNPPLLYLLVRMSVRALGDSHFSVRFPSLAAFFGAGLVLFLYERKRSGGGYGLTALALLFLSGFLPYATEARPYALELFFVSVAYTSWLVAILADRRAWPHLTLMLAVAGLFMSHCFAPVFVIPIIGAELMRSLKHHRCDWNVLGALVIPLPLTLLDIVLIAKPGHILSDLPAKWTTLYTSYRSFLLPFVVPSGLLLATSLLVRRPLEGRWRSSCIPMHEAVLLGGGVAVPVLLIVCAITMNIAFHIRYAIGIAVPLSLLTVRMFERLALRSASAGVLAALLLLINFATHGIGTIPKPSQRATDLSGLMVAANGGRFLELDHYGGQDFVTRLFYLTDRDAATRYARSTAFEDFTLLKEAYPVRANIVPYSDFVSAHKRFRVISFPADSQWLMSKLRADGATIVTSERASWLYDVTMR
jgi:hypothetical protein